MKNSKILGLDLGEKTMGIAISDLSQLISIPLEVFRFENHKYDKAIAYLLNLCEEKEIKKVVLGLPKHMNGDLGLKAQISEKFKEELNKNNIEVILIDERYTSKIATNTLIEGGFSRKKRKTLIDKMAAQIILQSYLDKRRKEKDYE